jgi:hypothetical protein
MRDYFSYLYWHYFCVIRLWHSLSLEGASVGVKAHSLVLARQSISDILKYGKGRPDVREWSPDAFLSPKTKYREGSNGHKT